MRVCASQAELKARQQKTADAFDQLADRVAGGAAAPAATGSSALVVNSEWSTSAILSTVSLKEQMRLIEEHVALSERQMALDAEDEALMKIALDLYQDERAARERRVEILQQQRTLLVELHGLVEDTSAFNGHATFAKKGFAEGLTY